jgi:hypothetical protein
MRRRKFVTALAIGLAGVLLAAPSQAAARPDGTARADDRAHAKEVDIVPLVAVEQISRTVRGVDGTLRTTRETNRLYRDSAGRTRHESGATVTINDPKNGTTVQLDTGSRTYTRSADAKQPTEGAAPSSQPKAEQQQVSSAPKSLGTATVGGVRAEGSAYTLTLQRDGKAPLTKDVTVWIAKDIQLDVSMRVVELSGEEYSKTYTDIRTGVAPAPELFTVPAGYHAAEPTTAGTRADCPLDISNDPLVLISYGLLVFGEGTQRGSTDFANAGCLIVDTVAITQLPLVAEPITPYLGLPYFDWKFRDNQDPFVLCNSVWFGSAGFLAYNTEDTTEKWSVVALYVYC